MKTKKLHKMTLGLVLSSIPKYSETFFRNKIKGLQDNGVEVILFVSYPNAVVTEIDCKVVYMPVYSNSKFKNGIQVFKALCKLLFVHPKVSFKHYQLDTIDNLSFIKKLRNLIVNQKLLLQQLDWLHFGFGTLTINKENVAKAIGAKMGVSFRGYDLYISPLKHPNYYKRLFTKQVKYHVLSHEMKDDLKNFGITPEHIDVITPAIDVKLFKGDTTQTKQTNTIINITTVARLHWKKGLEYTLQALALLKAEGVDFKYTIIGTGIEQERLLFAAHQLGIYDNVNFIGRLPQKEVKTYLQTTDVYLQYSIQEGFCNAVLEAQAMGALCIVSNAEGLQENVINEHTGWVVNKRQPIALKTKILEVLNLDKTKKQTIRNNAIIRVNEKFNLKQQQDAFVNFYFK